jgi:hypothetical protein
VFSEKYSFNDNLKLDEPSKQSFIDNTVPKQSFSFCDDELSDPKAIKQSIYDDELSEPKLSEIK